MNLEMSDYAKLIRQQDPGILLSLPTRNYDCSYSMSSHLLFKRISHTNDYIYIISTLSCLPLIPLFILIPSQVHDCYNYY